MLFNSGITHLPQWISKIPHNNHRSIFKTTINENQTQQEKTMEQKPKDRKFKESTKHTVKNTGEPKKKISKNLNNKNQPNNTPKSVHHNNTSTRIII